jgi:hypothetical protein
LAWTISRAAAPMLAPLRDPGRGRARLSHPGAAAPPKTGGVGLTLWQLLAGLQALLACWAGACPPASGRPALALPPRTSPRADLTEPS